jgi:hypothetical protein
MLTSDASIGKASISFEPNLGYLCLSLPHERISQFDREETIFKTKSRYFMYCRIKYA